MENEIKSLKTQLAAMTKDRDRCYSAVKSIKTIWPKVMEHTKGMGLDYELVILNAAIVLSERRD